MTYQTKTIENMNKLRQAYDNLQSEVMNTFDSLIKNNGEIKFLSDELTLDENLEELPSIDLINSSGEQYFVRVIEISNDGSLLVYDEEMQKQSTKIFSDINDLYYKIDLVEQIEEFLK